MNQMEAAFAKAGVPTGAVAFASACHDLARLALNRQRDPARAVPVFLGLAGGADFRRALEQFLVAVAAERDEPKSGDGTGHRSTDAQSAHARPSPETLTAGERGHTDADALSESAPSPAATPSDDGTGQPARDAQTSGARPSSERGSGGHGVLDAHQRYASAPAPRSPSPAQNAAVTRVKADTARVLSGIFITERQGGRTALDLVQVGSIDRRLRQAGRTAARGAVEYNMLFLVKRQVGKQAFVPEGAVVGDVLAATELQHLYDIARAFASSPMVTLPEELRQELAA